MRKIVHIVPLIILLLHAGTISASVSDQMGAFFNDMTNVTPGGSFETQSRGVLAGGSIETRTKVMSPNLIAFQAPSISEPSCAAVSAFGGSFSFINSEQLIQLLRSIAANAANYAFSLALGALCPSCLAELKSLSDKLQEMNARLGNSCKIAEYLVDNTIKGTIEEVGQSTDKIGSTVGIFTDFFEAQIDNVNQGISSMTTAANANVPAVDSEIEQNVVWDALQTENVSNWFFTNTVPNETLQLLMSVTGTLIIRKKEIVGDPGNFTFEPIALPPTITLKDIYYGNTLADPSTSNTPTVILCQDFDKCLNPEVVTAAPPAPAWAQQIKGMRTYVKEILLGIGGQPGIVEKIALNLPGGLTDPEKAFITSHRGPTLSIIRNLAKERGVAEMVIESAADYIALQHTIDLTDQLLASVRLATAKYSHKDGYKTFIANFRESQRELANERKKLKSTSDNLLRVMQLYDIAKNNLLPQKASLTGQIVKSGSSPSGN